MGNCRKRSGTKSKSLIVDPELSIPDQIANILVAVLFSVYSAVYQHARTVPATPGAHQRQTSPTDPFMPCDCTYLSGTSRDHNGQSYGCDGGVSTINGEIKTIVVSMSSIWRSR